MNDEELEAVIAHELTHIRNRDVRLLIVSIVFVGIFSMLTQITFYTITHTRIRSNGKNGGGAILIILIALVIAAVGYFFARLIGLCDYFIIPARMAMALSIHTKQKNLKLLVNASPVEQLIVWG